MYTGYDNASIKPRVAAFITRLSYQWGWTSLTHVQFNLNHGCTSDLEGLSEDQPCEHPHQGVPGNRVERDNLVSSAPWRVPDSHSAETLVPVPQPRGAELRDRERVRVRKESLRRAVRGGLRQGSPRVDAGHRSRAIRR